MMNDRITTPFGATSTAEQVLAGVDLTGKRAVVTGASSGIGLETARVLAHAGAAVTLAVRNIDAGHKAAADIKHSTGNEEIDAAEIELADLVSLAGFVKQWHGPLHILVNNAGVMATPESRTSQGLELQFATNHLGHFALATGLHEALSLAEGARVVVVSSVGHVNGDVDFDDIQFQRRAYDPFTAYGQSKTANVMFAVEAAKRWASDHIMVNALNPGRITSTKLSRHIGVDPLAVPSTFEPGSTDVSYKNIEQGAATSVLLAGSPLVDGVSGRYFEDCQEAVPYRPGVRRGVADWALDPERAGRLWQVSLDLLNTSAY